MLGYDLCKRHPVYVLLFCLAIRSTIFTVHFLANFPFDPLQMNQQYLPCLQNLSKYLWNTSISVIFHIKIQISYLNTTAARPAVLRAPRATAQTVTGPWFVVSTRRGREKHSHISDSLRDDGSLPGADSPDKRFCCSWCSSASSSSWLMKASSFS